MPTINDLYCITDDWSCHKLRLSCEEEEGGPHKYISYHQSKYLWASFKKLLWHEKTKQKFLTIFFFGFNFWGLPSMWQRDNMDQHLWVVNILLYPSITDKYSILWHVSKYLSSSMISCSSRENQRKTCSTQNWWFLLNSDLILCEGSLTMKP